jgi:hypothetical protein
MSVFFLSLSRNSLRIMERYVLSPCSQKPNDRSYLESLNPSSIHTLLPYASILILLYCRLSFPWVSIFGFFYNSVGTSYSVVERFGDWWTIHRKERLVTYSRHYPLIFRRNWGKSRLRFKPRIFLQTQSRNFMNKGCNSRALPRLKQTL